MKKDNNLHAVKEKEEGEEGKTPVLPSAVPSAVEAGVDAEKPKLSRSQQRQKEAEDKEYQRLAEFYDNKLIEHTEKFLLVYSGGETEADFLVLDQFDEVWKMLADNHNRKKKTPLHVERNAFINYISKLKQLAKYHPQPKQDLENKDFPQAPQGSISKEEANQHANNVQQNLMEQYHEKKNLIFKGFNLFGLLEFMNKDAGHFIDNFSKEQALELSEEMQNVFNVDIIYAPAGKGYTFTVKIPDPAEVGKEKEKIVKDNPE